MDDPTIPGALIVHLDQCVLFLSDGEMDFGLERPSFSQVSPDRRRLQSELGSVHLNDAKKDLGSRVDRHEHIGKGAIGKEPFGFFLNDRRLRKIPFLLEIPKGEKRDMDRVNLRVLRKLVR